MHTGPGYDGVFCGADYRLRDIFLKHLATRESVQFQVCPLPPFRFPLNRRWHCYVQASKQAGCVGVGWDALWGVGYGTGL